MNARGATICISQQPQHKEPLAIDEEMYKSRYLVENFLCDLKGFRCIALRTDKTDLSFIAIINACADLLSSR